MKKVSTVGTQQTRNFTAEADDRIGSGRSQQLVLRAGRSGPDPTGAARAHDCESSRRSLRRNAALSDYAGDRDAFALDQSLAQRVGTRSDRRECPQGAADRREPEERRSLGRPDLSAAGPNRSAVAVSSKTSQRAGTSRSDDDSRPRRPGARRTGLVNARGLAKSYGERLRGCNVRNINPEKADGRARNCSGHWSRCCRRSKS